MIFINQVFFAIIITTLTGTITFGLWRCLQRFFLSYNPNLVYLTLRLVCLMYLIPVGYIAVRLTVTDATIQTDEIRQMHVHTNDMMNFILWCAELIWIILTVRCFTTYLIEDRRRQKVCRNNIPVEDEAILEEFSRIKKKIGVKRKVGLYYNPGIQTPMITGLIYGSVLLPKRVYSKEQLTVIFYHELTHCKNHDLLLKFCSILGSMLQHLNAYANLLLLLLDEWSECYCDAKALDAMRDEITPKRYFEVIIGIVESTAEVQGGGYIFSMLYENQRCLERRIDYMGKYMKVSSKAKKSDFAMVVLFAFLSVSAAYAAGSGMVKVHNTIYKDMEILANQSIAQAQMDEKYIEAGENDSYQVMVTKFTGINHAGALLNPFGITRFSWNVNPNTRCVSENIPLKRGQKLNITATVTPSENTVWVGIMDSKGSVRYVEGDVAVAHTFWISESDNYRILIQNRGLRTVTSNGSYYNYYY